MTATHRDKLSSDSVDTASDWDTGIVPGYDDQLFIGALGTYTVASSSNETVASIASLQSITSSTTIPAGVSASGNALTLIGAPLPSDNTRVQLSPTSTGYLNKVATDSSNITSYPNNDVVLIETTNPGALDTFVQASGVIIGPHTILTASHVLWDGVTNTEANAVYLYPGYNSVGFPNPAGTANPLSTPAIWHNFELSEIPNPNGSTSFVTKSETAFDYAVIDVATTFSSWVPVAALSTNFVSGAVSIAGHPAADPNVTQGFQTTNFGSVSQDTNTGILDYADIGPIYEGNSGGPVWISGTSGPVVVGVVSTVSSACKLTIGDIQTIESWESADSHLWSSPGPNATIFPFTGDLPSQVEALYIGYFGRGGDPQGFSYWLDQLTSGADSLSAEAASFSVQDESEAQYAFLANPITATQEQIASFINSVSTSRERAPIRSSQRIYGTIYFCGRSFN
jgi:V8-like Glu-specific endopeptidase